jgi:hypothetical protein
MQITRFLKILKAKNVGDRSYLIVFEADNGTFELFLPGGGYPGEFTGFINPTLRNQSTGQSWVNDWAHAELIAAHLETVIDTAGADEAVALKIVAALTTGKRLHDEVS